MFKMKTLVPIFMNNMNYVNSSGVSVQVSENEARLYNSLDRPLSIRSTDSTRIICQPTRQKRQDALSTAKSAPSMKVPVTAPGQRS